MIRSAARMSLVAMFTLGALAVWGCGPTQLSGGDEIPPADTETVVLHIEGMT